MQECPRRVTVSAGAMEGVVRELLVDVAARTAQTAQPRDPAAARAALRELEQAASD